MYRPICEITGLVTLTNTRPYPFNDSVRTVALPFALVNPDYSVQTRLVEADGPVDAVQVTAQAVNGFKIAFRGSASRAVIRYHVFGGPAHDPE